MSEHDLDLEGLKCPLPALRTRRALARLNPGDVLTVVCTDPLASIDLPHLLRELGDVLDGLTRDDGRLVFKIRKCSPQEHAPAAVSEKGG